VVASSRLSWTRKAAGTASASPRILYTGLAANPAERRISLRVSDPARAADVARILREAAIQVTAGATAQQPDIEVTTSPDGTVTATLTEVALRNKASSAVEQSLEIVRRRIDESGLVEALIARQGQNRILVQLPGVDDPARIKDLLGRTARMTFHLVDESIDPRATTPPPSGTMILAGERGQERAGGFQQSCFDMNGIAAIAQCYVNDHRASSRLASAKAAMIASTVS
jgi:preprotein translocase subunit SecD